MIDYLFGLSWDELKNVGLSFLVIYGLPTAAVVVIVIPLWLIQSRMKPGPAADRLESFQGLVVRIIMIPAVIVFFVAAAAIAVVRPVSLVTDLIFFWR